MAATFIYIIMSFAVDMTIRACGSITGLVSDVAFYYTIYMASGSWDTIWICLALVFVFLPLGLYDAWLCTRVWKKLQNLKKLA